MERFRKVRKTRKNGVGQLGRDKHEWSRERERGREKLDRDRKEGGGGGCCETDRDRRVGEQS